VRGLQPTGASRQLALPVAGLGPVDAVWASLAPDARERILRLLAAAIARMLNEREEQW
jgi:hypothetical protein